ncbi:hypothetical protein THAOC_18170, partial [Thalassiosira oceanica]
MVVVADDCALPRTKGITGARGVAGTVLVHKAAGGKAGEDGAGLADVTAAAEAGLGRRVDDGRGAERGDRPGGGGGERPTRRAGHGGRAGHTRRGGGEAVSPRELRRDRRGDAGRDPVLRADRAGRRERRAAVREGGRAARPREQPGRHEQLRDVPPGTVGRLAARGRG